MADVRGSTPLGSTVKSASDLRKHGSEALCSLRRAAADRPSGPLRAETFLTVVALTPPDTVRTDGVIDNNRRERAS